MAQNAFEALRKPHLVALDLDAGAIAPAPEVDPANAVAASPAPVTPVGSVATTPKQDKLAPSRSPRRRQWPNGARRR